MLGDKDVNSVLQLMPRDATYYFCQASVRRSMPSNDLADLAQRHGLHGSTFDTVAAAYISALESANPDDLVFVGGSSYVVADLLCFLEKKHQISTIVAK